MRRLTLTLGLILAIAGTASAEEIRLLTAGSLQRGLAVIAEMFKSETGHDVTIEVGTTPVMTQRLEAGDMFDIVIGTRAVVDAAAARGQVDDSFAPVVGRVGIGIAVRAAVETDEVRTVEDLEALLLAADSVVYNRGSSGVFSQSMIESLGISAQIESKTTQYPNGGDVLAHVRDGDGTDLGFAPLTEVRANAPNGIGMIALPDEVQNYTSYTAVVGTGAVEPAADFVRYMTTEPARNAFAASGVD